MKERKQNALIGLFVLGGLVSLGVLMVKFGEAAGLLRAGYTVHAQFDRVAGMREGLEVSLAGVPIGRVMGVDLVDRDDPGKGVLVAMEINKQFKIPSGSVARALTPLMGQTAINIRPPATPTQPLPDNGTAQIRGEQTSALSEVIDPRMMTTVEKTTAQIGELAAALTPAANDLHLLLQQRTVREVDAAIASGLPTTQETAANLSTAVERLHNVLKHFETVLGDPAVQSNLKETLANFRAASEEVKLAAAGFHTFSTQAQEVGKKADAVVTKLDATVDTTHKRIDELGKSLLVNSDKMSKMFDYFILASRDLAEGKGTLGLFLRDPQFYEEMLLTVKRLSAAATDLQALIRQWQAQGLLGK